MKGAHVWVEHTFENLTSDDAADVTVNFQFRVAKWSESVPYGMGSTRMPMSEEECTGIFVGDKSLSQDELEAMIGQKITDATWESLQEQASEQI